MEDILCLMSLFEMVILTLTFCFFNVVTRSYPKLLILFHLFYTTRNGKKIKTINNELLIYLDDIALAYWAMDDGAWTKSGFIYIQKIYIFRNISISRDITLPIYIGLFCSRS